MLEPQSTHDWIKAVSFQSWGEGSRVMARMLTPIAPISSEDAAVIARWAGVEVTAAVKP